MLRREFLFSAATAAAVASRPVFGAGRLNRKQRVDRALKGEEVDRSPFTFWHHFGLKTAQAHADRTLDFHKRYRTDIVKAVSYTHLPQAPIESSLSDSPRLLMGPAAVRTAAGSAPAASSTACRYRR